MSEERFSADWLQQREPFDTAARNAAAQRLRLAARLAQQRPAGAAPWRVIDLACGTGANLRWLAPRLGGAHTLLVLDSPHSGTDYPADYDHAVPRALLRRGDGLDRVAQQVGYGSAAALSRAFSAVCGVSPREWRQAISRNTPG